MQAMNIVGRQYTARCMAQNRYTPQRTRAPSANRRYITRYITSADNSGERKRRRKYRPQPARPACASKPRPLSHPNLRSGGGEGVDRREVSRPATQWCKQRRPRRAFHAAQYARSKQQCETPARNAQRVRNPQKCCYATRSGANPNNYSDALTKHRYHVSGAGTA